MTLDTSNSYTNTVTYTPSKAGNTTITATFQDGTVLEHQLFVSPYSTTIGFIGDSITQGTCGG
jgi:hypothetical protein